MNLDVKKLSLSKSIAAKILKQSVHIYLFILINAIKNSLYENTF